jgi:N-methylhydantoinase A
MQVIGVDAGGTFTDSVVTTADGRVAVGKALSTPDRVELGVMASLADVAGRLGTTLSDLLVGTDVLSHGTTVGLNALLTGTGARVGLLTTAGFESTLAIAKANKVHGLAEEEFQQPSRWQKPKLLVPRRLTRGVRERIDANGTVVVPLNVDDARRAVDELARLEVESVAIALLWSVANPVHERLLADVVRSRLPDVHLVLSSDLVPKLGEFERTSTVVVDAYVGPLVSAYLKRLEACLRAEAFRGVFVVMRMGGGVLPAELAAAMPVHTLHSGPVGGVSAASHLGRRLGHENVITTDVGGTSFDVGLVTGGAVLYSSKPMIERQALAIPVVDVTSIGTGGGSIARIDASMGALRVGPASAGASPGPACYGRGGVAATVTDAAVVLGYVDRLGGELELDVGAAFKAVQVGVAGPMGVDVYDAADGILQVACEQMHDLVRRVIVQRGHDPSDFVLYAFGGAGPQYVGRYAAELGVADVVIPVLAAEFSAYGAAASELKAAMEQDLVPGSLDRSAQRIDAALEHLEAAARAQLAGSSMRLGGIEPTIVRTVGLRYYRQLHRIDLALPAGSLDAAGLEALLAEFRLRYERLVGEGTARTETPIEAVTVGLELVVDVPRAMPPLRPIGVARPVRRRSARFDGAAVDCPVFRWDDVGAGQRIAGPAFVESEQTTVVIYPDQAATADRFGNVRIEL